MEGAWFLPAFWFTDSTDLTIDICTPPRLDGGVWSFVDLELDLFRSADGCAGIVDQDEKDPAGALPDLLSLLADLSDTPPEQRIRGIEGVSSRPMVRVW